MHVAQLRGAAPQVPRRQNPFECVPEFRIENRIDNRIEGRIRVAQPRKNLERLAANARLAESRHNVDAKERHPANQEYAHDDAHCDGRLVIGHMIR